MPKTRIDEFFAYARARHEITLRRQAGLPREEWTDDPILQKYRFTCVFRELDKTTAWFRGAVRDPMRDKPEVLLATVIFRMFNRIEVGEAIFCQTMIGQVGRRPSATRSTTAFEEYCRTGDTRVLKSAIKTFKPKPPYATGAYIISSPPGHTKLDGILWIIDQFNKKSGWRERSGNMITANGQDTLENCWHWLKEQPYLGSFHSYEIVTDLRHTALLDRAPDIMTWANVGPGARRGANRVFGREKKFRSSEEQVQEEMRELLTRSLEPKNWPQRKGKLHAIRTDCGVYTHKLCSEDLQWPAWELRDVEHTLCEFDKYMRVRMGETTKKGGLATPRGVYR